MKAAINELVHNTINGVLVSAIISFLSYTCGKYRVSFGVLFFGDVFSIFPPLIFEFTYSPNDIRVFEICSYLL